MAVLHLTLKKKWFDMILSGEKKEEYRIIKPYWITRLEDKQFDVVQFRLGYAKDAPMMQVECKEIKKSLAVGKWSDNAFGIHYVIVLGEILYHNQS